MHAAASRRPRRRPSRRSTWPAAVKPSAATLAFVASAAMAGVPLLNGFLSKEMFFAETVDLSSIPWLDYGLPVAATVAIGDAAEDARRRIDEMQQQQQQLLAQIRRELAAMPPPDPQREAGDPKEREQDERRRQLLQLLAEIEKRINEQNARPKKRYISPATREAVYALYYDGLRRRIEERGTRNFPEANGRKLYGELTMNVTVDAAGRVVEAEIVRPSASRRLDQQAVAIVHAASPFGPFSPAMRAQADQIVVTSRFRFTRDEGLETQPMAQ